MADFRQASGGALAFIPAMVLYDTELTDKAKLVYAEIARLLGSDGYCWARDQYLADVCSCSVKTVSRAIHDLAAAGYIQVELGANKKGAERHIYIGRIAPQGGMDKNVHTVKNDQRGMDKNVQTPPATQYKKNNNNTDIRARTRTRTREVPEAVDTVFRGFAGDDAELYQRIMDLAEVRQSKRKPYRTARQASMLCSKLTRISGGSRAIMVSILDTAIEHGWDSVYAPRDSEQPRPAPTPGAVKEADDVETWEG
nr:helix-turn-helix domain-containing protein [uncultured Dysosmobacter sp.]